MRGVKKNSFTKRVFFNFYIKLFYFNNLNLFFNFSLSLPIRFFYFLTFQFFFIQVSTSFIKLIIGLNNNFTRKKMNQFFKDTITEYDTLYDSDSKESTAYKRDLVVKLLDTQFFNNNTENSLQEDDTFSEKDEFLIAPFKEDIFSTNLNLFLYNYAYNYILSQKVVINFFSYVLNKSYCYSNILIFFKLKLLNHNFVNFVFYYKEFIKRRRNFLCKAFSFKFFFLYKNFIFFNEKKQMVFDKIGLLRGCYKYFSLRAKQQFFLNRYFSIFSQHFFYSFVPFGLKFNSSTNINQKILSSLLFLPDSFLFLNHSGFFVKEKKYTNIVPLFNIQLNLRFKQKKVLPLKNTNIFLWYLLNFFENKLQKPIFLKLIYSRKSIFKKSIYSYCIRVFRKLKRYNYRFKRNFFLGEIIRVAIVSLMSRDSTLFINYVTWVLIQIPYKDVKGFLYFLKVLLKKHLLPKFKDFFLVKGFVFDIRGKVGVTGDAKKRHTLISWGQSSFSEKNLKLSLKQGLVYTRTGVMGVTVIIIF